MSVIFPTRRNLERLAALGSFEAALAQVQALPMPPPLITPWTEDRDGTQQLCIPTAMGYPVTSQLMTEVRRG